MKENIDCASIGLHCVRLIVAHCANKSTQLSKNVSLIEFGLAVPSLCRHFAIALQRASVLQMSIIFPTSMPARPKTKPSTSERFA